MKKVILAGASGLVGRKLFGELVGKYEVVLIGRNWNNLKHQLPGALEYVDWSEIDTISKAIDGSYGIINLSGAPIVGKRWSKAYKKILRDSRIVTTKTLVEAIGKAESKPEVFINASAVGYHGVVEQKIPFIETDKPGDDFLARLCVEWEAEAMKAKLYKTRNVVIRSGIILDKNEGALPQMLTPFKFFVGGHVGNGKQKFPWIHIDDEVGIIMYALEQSKVQGPINAVAPEIVTSHQLANSIGAMIHRPSIVPVPKIMLKILYGEASQVLTSGTSISSKKITHLGYKFNYPTLKSAITNILS